MDERCIGGCAGACVCVGSCDTFWRWGFSYSERSLGPCSGLTNWPQSRPCVYDACTIDYMCLNRDTRNVLIDDIQIVFLVGIIT